MFHQIITTLHRLCYPITARFTQASNLLRNGDFQEDWSEAKSHDCLVFTESGPLHKQVGNIFTPPGWLTWFQHSPKKWDQPEVRDAHRAIHPRRVKTGSKATLLFTFYRKHHAGFLQQVLQVTPGQRLRFTAHGHAWSNHHTTDLGGDRDNGKWSDGAPIVGKNIVALTTDQIPQLSGKPQNDAVGNIKLTIGIDPTGGRNPSASTVVWSEARFAYNGYGDFPPMTVEATAQRGVVTVFLRSKTLWAFKHNDVYWDDTHLEVIPETPPIPAPPDPTPTPTPATPPYFKIGAIILKEAPLTTEVSLVAPLSKQIGVFSTKVNPNALIIGRVISPYDAQFQYYAHLTPKEAAAQFIQAQQTQYLLNPSIEHWEGHNEPVWNTTEEMYWYAEFEVERMKLMATLGLKCIIGNFATGTPDLSLWPAFFPALTAAIQYQGILGLHEYSCPWMWWMTGKHQIDPTADEKDEGWTTLRYRKVYRQWLIPNDLGTVPLAITECGIDPMISPQPPGANSGTWSQLHNFWKEWDGPLPIKYTGDPASYYLQQLHWYNTELQKDNYVIGATVFAMGNYGGLWKHFDIAGTPVAEGLIKAANAQPASPFNWYNYQPLPAPPDPTPTPDPTPDPTPTPSQGMPRVQYKRTFVLLHTAATLAWAQAAAKQGWKWGYTTGQSADDAGVGDLNYRRVLAVNPHLWPTSLQDFFEEHYPGVDFIPITANTPADLLLPGPDNELPTPTPPPTPTPTIKPGLHDLPGGFALAAAGHANTTCLVHITVTDRPLAIDLRDLTTAGIQPILRITRGYADGTGTVPSLAEADQWCKDVAETINNIKWGTATWIKHLVCIFNEENNPQEWPGGWEHPSLIVSPQYVVSLFNKIALLTNLDVNLTCGVIDPYNVVAAQHGQPGDPKDWALYKWVNCNRLDWIAIHAKTQTSNIDEIAGAASRQTFTDAPLLGRSLHLGTIQEQLSWMPPHIAALPVYITELNPQRNLTGDRLGWDTNTLDWITAAATYLSKLPIEGWMLYRWEEAGDQANFALCNTPDILKWFKNYLQR